MRPSPMTQYPVFRVAEVSARSFGANWAARLSALSLAKSLRVRFICDRFSLSILKAAAHQLYLILLSRTSSISLPEHGTSSPPNQESRSQRWAKVRVLAMEQAPAIPAFTFGRTADFLSQESWTSRLPWACRNGLLPFPLTCGIIRVCLDLAGLFRNKDIRLVLMIRLARRGARKQPHYRIVVIEKERARNGRPVEVVGTYNPRTNPASIELKRDRVEYWVSKGAQMSDRVNKLFSKPAPAPASAGSAA